MLNIFLMVTNLIQIMQLNVLKLQSQMVHGGLFFVIRMEELFRMKLKISYQKFLKKFQEIILEFMHIMTQVMQSPILLQL